jgi:hypothetical protein
MTALTIYSALSDFKLSKESIEGELEVEQLLHDIGIFSDDCILPEDQTDATLKDSTNFLPEYDHATVSADESEVEEFSSDGVATRCSIETMENFSVPNPFAVSVPDPIASYASVAVKVEPAPEEQVQVHKSEQDSAPNLSQRSIKVEPSPCTVPSKAANSKSLKRKSVSPVSVTASVPVGLDDKELTEEQMEERR